MRKRYYRLWIEDIHEELDFKSGGGSYIHPSGGKPLCRGTNKQLTELRCAAKIFLDLKCATGLKGLTTTGI